MRIPFTALIVTIVASLAAACGGGGADDPTPTAIPATATEAPPLSTADLARSVVQIVALDDTRTPLWTGSGTVVTSDGLILTNAHVVDDRAGEYDVLGVAITDRTDQPPEPSFLASIVAVDYILDLAVIQVESDLSGDEVDLDLETITIGDSDAVEIGDPIRILGFPSIGGETITFTEGAISGFSSQRAIADRAWIKTDATISGGNSGGLAVNAAGEIIGVPTIVGSNSETDVVDCRFLVDTNRDGTIDTGDTCVPVGGFINGIRPIALAVALIEAAEAGELYVSPYVDEPPVGVTIDLENVLIDNLAFASGVTPDDLPTELVATLPSGAPEVCAFFDYEGMADGAEWEALWFVDSELSDGGSIIGEPWIGGESGSWWVCFYDDLGLLDGLYELVLTVEGEAQITESLFVGGSHPPVDFTVINESGLGICFVQISPSSAEGWGQDELAGDEVIEAGDDRTFTIPAAMYDLRLIACDGDSVIEEVGLDIVEDGSFTVG